MENTCGNMAGAGAGTAAGAGAGRPWLAPLICLGVLYTLFCAISFFTVPMGDDWRLIATSINGGSFQAAIDSYLTFNPRLTEDLLAWFCGLPYYPMLVWKTLNPLFLLWLNYSIVGIAVDRDTISRSRHLWLLLASSLVFFTMGGNRAWNQFWMDGGCNWLWSHTFIAGMFHQLVRACRGKKMGWWRYTLLFVCGVFTGWSTETAALSAGATFGLMALAYFRKGRRGAFVAAGAGLAVGAAFFFGCIFFIIGLDSRTLNYGADSLAFSHLSIWEKFLQPIPTPAYNLALPAALLFCLAVRGNDDNLLNRLVRRGLSRFTDCAWAATAAIWISQGVLLYYLLEAYWEYAQRMAYYPGAVMFALWLALGLVRGPQGAPALGLPHAKALWWAALSMAFLPLPMSLNWTCHATLLYPSLVLILGCIYCANRLTPVRLKMMCGAGWGWAAPHLVLIAIILYGLNLHTRAIREGVARALEEGRTEIVLPLMEDYVPDYSYYPYQMDSHLRPFTWYMGDNPDDTINRWVRQGCGLTDEYRIIFRPGGDTTGK